MTVDTLSKVAPRVSVGIPVYNGASTITHVIESLLAQTFYDFELIISDNASNDGTSKICRQFANNDRRIRYVRQKSNIGPAANFRFLVDTARAPYFLWAACDDIRSPNFLEENVRFLDANPDYVASASPNCLEGQEWIESRLVTFAIEGPVEQRFLSFFKNAWSSHGIYYSLIRVDILRRCELLGQRFLGVDWGINLFLASFGKIGRVEKGLTVFGAGGDSVGPNAWSLFRTNLLCWFLPFYKLSVYSYKLSLKLPTAVRFQIFLILIKLNIYAAFFQIFTELRLMFKRN